MSSKDTLPRDRIISYLFMKRVWVPLLFLAFCGLVWGLSEGEGILAKRVAENEAKKESAVFTLAEIEEVFARNDAVFLRTPVVRRVAETRETTYVRRQLKSAREAYSLLPAGGFANTGKSRNYLFELRESERTATLEIVRAR